MSVSINGTNGLVFSDGTSQNTSPFTGGFAFRNKLINGAMQIDQRNAGASVTAGAGNTYTVDRWMASTNQASKFTVQQNAGSVTPPVGFTSYLGATSSSAYSVLTGDYMNLQQRIEGFNIADLNWGTANAAAVTLSFWVRSSLTGTFGGALKDSTNNYSYAFSYTINSANTWEQKTLTIAGPTSGTWSSTNGFGVGVLFSLGAGATYSGTTGSWSSADYRSATGATSVVGTNGATFYITGVQLEKGSTATSFDYRPYGTELALCQRYYQIMGQGCYAAVRAASQWVFTTSYQNMRSAPTATLLTTAPVVYNFFTGTNITGSGGVINDSSLGVNASTINVTAYSGQTAGQIGSAATVNLASLSAEL